MKDMKRKVVYALEMSNDTVKIGISSQIDLRVRQVENASGMDILNVYKTGELPHELAIAIEAEAHKHFADFRLNGEFFKVDFVDAVNFLWVQEKLGKYNETTKELRFLTFDFMSKLKCSSTYGIAILSDGKKYTVSTNGTANEVGQLLMTLVKHLAKDISENCIESDFEDFKAGMRIVMQEAANHD